MLTGQICRKIQKLSIEMPGMIYETGKNYNFQSLIDVYNICPFEEKGFLIEKQSQPKMVQLSKLELGHSLQPVLKRGRLWLCWKQLIGQDMVITDFWIEEDCQSDWLCSRVVQLSSVEKSSNHLWKFQFQVHVQLFGDNFHSRCFGKGGKKARNSHTTLELNAFFSQLR